MERAVVRRLILVAATAAPAALLGVMTAGMLLRGVIGGHPLWRSEPVNLSEAAALRDQATVVQLIRRGDDPYQRREIRADLLFNDRAELTAFEAAIASGRAEVMDVLLFSARRPSPEEWGRLRCLSTKEGDDDIDEVLDRYKPESAVLACDGVTRPWK
jgi:hypothetical protein